MCKYPTSEFEKTRITLLESIKKFREQDFLYQANGMSIIEHLLNLCNLEQSILTDNASQSITPQKNRDLLSQEQQIMPPQVIHHLASLRHKTLHKLQNDQDEYNNNKVLYRKLLDEEEKIIDKINEMSKLNNKGHH
jgi:hypothetical protein